MDHILKKKILQELPLGECVKYIGPSAFLKNKTGIIISSKAKYMNVKIGRREYRLRYYNLTCEQIELAERVHRKLLGIPEPEEEDLPF